MMTLQRRIDELEARRSAPSTSLTDEERANMILALFKLANECPDDPDLQHRAKAVQAILERCRAHRDGLAAACSG